MHEAFVKPLVGGSQQWRRIDYLPLARRTGPAVRLVAAALNRSAMPGDEARDHAAGASTRLGVSVFDPLRSGMEAVVTDLLH